VLDITERKHAEQTIQYMTYHDATTGLPNRALLHERLQGTIERADASTGPVSLLIIALDRFREINNTLGHQNGDRIIRELAQRLGDLLGDRDRVARLRGDEFAMVVPGADARLGQQLGLKVQKTLEEPFMIDRLPIEVIAGVGVAVAPDHGNSAEALLRRADLAVQVAKREGRGCVVYSAECDPYDPQRVALMGELRRAIEANELVLHYQPKVDIRSQAVVGAEALVRWQHAKRGLLSPDHFVPLAEQGGLIKLLTHWVLRQALEQCQTWARERRPLSIAVNLSARNLHDSQLAEQIGELLESCEVAAQQLELEVTESAVMVDPVRAAAILGVLEQSGVTLAIDDFGTGYSSLAYLRSLPVSELKIDKSFVMGLGANGNGNATIVRSTSDLGHNLGLSVVAEGVEDQQTLDLLGSFGCDGAQGYHIGRPMPAVQLEQWLSDSPWRVSEG
jgi:diguanylate cyclase (GGDEF)-like protein